MKTKIQESVRKHKKNKRIKTITDGLQFVQIYKCSKRERLSTGHSDKVCDFVDYICFDGMVDVAVK